MTKQLKKLLLVFYLILIASFAISVLLVAYFIFLKGSLPLFSDKVNNKTIPWTDVIWSSYSVLFSGFLAYGMLQLRKAISYLSPENYFNTNVIFYFKKAGNTFITLGVILLIFHTVLQLYLSQGLYLVIDTILFCYLFILIIGIFFKLFGNAFIEGKKLLEENDLTI